VSGNDSLDGGAGTDTKITGATEKSIVDFPYKEADSRVGEALPTRRQDMKIGANTSPAGVSGNLLLRLAAALTMTALTALLYASAVWAETSIVTNTNDSGPGSLREALVRANSMAGGDEIAFADGLGGTVLLGESAITDEAGLSVDGGGDVTVTGTFVVSRGAAFSLRNITVSGGNSSSGGGIDNNGGTVEVSGSTFPDNHAADTGGGIANFGTLIVSGSTICGNFGDFDGGGIYNEGGAVDVTNSTISGNDGGMFGGGGILSYGGTMDVVNSTISGNISNGEEHCGGICGSGKTLRNTIVANNEGGNCAGPTTDGGYNVDDDGTCGFTQATGSLPNTDAPPRPRRPAR